MHIRRISDIFRLMRTIHSNLTNTAANSRTAAQKSSYRAGGHARSGHRSYSPALGRWLNRDPIGERGGKNLHSIVDNDPVRAIDYLGNRPADLAPGVYVDCGMFASASAFATAWTAENGSCYMGVCGTMLYAALEDVWNRDCSEDPEPSPPAAVGPNFRVCIRPFDVSNSRGLERLFMCLANKTLGGMHTMLQHHMDGKLVGSYGWGWKGLEAGSKGRKEDLLSDSTPDKACSNCSISSRQLKYGEATDQQANSVHGSKIVDCILSYPARANYRRMGYNCKSWAYEAAFSCGLDCPATP